MKYDFFLVEGCCLGFLILFSFIFAVKLKWKYENPKKTYFHFNIVFLFSEFHSIFLFMPTNIYFSFSIVYFSHFTFWEILLFLSSYTVLVMYDCYFYFSWAIFFYIKWKQKDLLLTFSFSTLHHLTSCYLRNIVTRLGIICLPFFSYIAADIIYDIMYIVYMFLNSANFRT